MATFTATCFHREPRVVDNGTATLFFRWNSGSQVFGSVGDVVLLGKLPLDATVTDGSFKGGSEAASAGSAVSMVLNISSPAEGSVAVRATMSGSVNSQVFTTTGNVGFAYPRTGSRAELANARGYSVLSLQITAAGSSVTSSFFLAGMLQYLTLPEL